MEGSGGTPKQTERGFFQSLFDFSFSSFIATRLIRFLYALIIVVMGLGLVVALIAGLTQGLKGLGLFVVCVIGAFLYLLLIRLSLEVTAVIFRIAEYLEEISSDLKRRPPA